MLLLSSRLLAAPQLSPEELEGEKLYKINCIVCHVMDKVVVGPSLVEIAHIYKKNPTGIVKWTQNPGQKRKGAIRMPPMAHIGQENLNRIAVYILKVTKGKKFKKSKKQVDHYAAFPSAKIQRMFMPDAGPAAIAVSLSDKLHLCWDAGTCQFRYAWSGDYIDQWPVLRGNGKGLVILKGKRFSYMNQGNPFSKNGKAKFHGYKRHNGLPIFMYTVDDVDFEVSFQAKTSQEVNIIFSSNAQKPLTYTPDLVQGKWSANKGSIKNGVLLLNKQESQKFTITFRAGEK
jgi:cytochrome c551/c552